MPTEPHKFTVKVGLKEESYSHFTYRAKERKQNDERKALWGLIWKIQELHDCLALLSEVAKEREC